MHHDATIVDKVSSKRVLTKYSKSAAGMRHGRCRLLMSVLNTIDAVTAIALRRDTESSLSLLMWLMASPRLRILGGVL